MNKIASFIKDNKGRNDSIGKICSDLLNDKNFSTINSEQDFIDYVNSISSLHPEVSEAILDLKKELGL